MIHEPDAPSENDIPTFSEEGNIRYMHFNSEWIQGGMDIDDPYRLVFEYAQQMMAWLLFVDPPRAPYQLGVLGLGAASFVRYPLKYMRSVVKAVEWNPMVTAACQMFFKLPVQGKRFQLDHADAGEWVLDTQNHHTCGVMLIDLYDADARGPVRESRAFYQGCKDVLSLEHLPSALTVNLFGDHASFPRNINTLQEVFGDRVFSLPVTASGNCVALALTGPPVVFANADAFLKRAQAIEDRYGLPALMWAQALLPKKQGAGLLVF